MPELGGHCQCGAVRYTLRRPPFFAVVCHCTECQRLASSAFSISMLVEREDFECTGPLACYRRGTTTGAVARCFFCPTCGNRVYHDAGDDVSRLRVKLPLAQRDQIHPRIQIWAENRQPWLAGLGGLSYLPAFQQQSFDPAVVKRRIVIGYGWTALRLGVQALGIVCIAWTAWHLATT